MEATYQYGLEFIAWLQTTFPQLAGFFLFITNLGLEEFYLAVFPMIYWCIHKELGKYLGALFLVTVMLNGIFKQTFRLPRPFWIDENIALDTREEGYGLPSGHVMYAMVFYFFIAGWVRKTWVWVVAVVLLFLMALSRVYLGVHFIQDVVAGFFISGTLLLMYLFWNRRYGTRFRKRILGQRLLVAVLVPLALGIAYIIILLIIGAPDMSVPWAEYIPAAERTSIDAVAQPFGLLLGFGVAVILEGSRIRFRADGSIWKRIVRYVVGMVVVLAIWRGLGIVFPREPLAVGVPLRIVRYFLLTLWIGYYAPWAFVKLRLADADPEPEISLKM